MKAAFVEIGTISEELLARAKAAREKAEQLQEKVSLANKAKAAEFNNEIAAEAMRLSAEHADTLIAAMEEGDDEAKKEFENLFQESVEEMVRRHMEENRKFVKALKKKHRKENKAIEREAHEVWVLIGEHLGFKYNPADSYSLNLETGLLRRIDYLPELNEMEATK